MSGGAWSKHGTWLGAWPGSESARPVIRRIRVRGLRRSAGAASATRALNCCCSRRLAQTAASVRCEVRRRVDESCRC
eukprot:3158809-Prymnesium_polylepis.1